MALAVLFVIILLLNIFQFSWELRVLGALIGIAWVALTIMQIVYLSRTRRRYTSPNTLQLNNGADLAFRTRIPLLFPLLAKLHSQIAILQD